MKLLVLVCVWFMHVYTCLGMPRPDQPIHEPQLPAEVAAVLQHMHVKRAPRAPRALLQSRGLFEPQTVCPLCTFVGTFVDQATGETRCYGTCRDPRPEFSAASVLCMGDREPSGRCLQPV